MRITLPLESIRDALIRQCLSTIETALIKVKEYAVVPPGGAAGSVLLKTDARNYNTAWSAAPTTGAQTASFAATNKPGAANGAPALWVPYVVNGTTYYLPLFN